MVVEDIITGKRDAWQAATLKSFKKNRKNNILYILLLVNIIRVIISKSNFVIVYPRCLSDQEYPMILSVTIKNTLKLVVGIREYVTCKGKTVPRATSFM